MVTRSELGRRHQRVLSLGVVCTSKVWIGSGCRGHFSPEERHSSQKVLELPLLIWAEGTSVGEARDLLIPGTIKPVGSLPPSQAVPCTAQLQGALGLRRHHGPLHDRIKISFIPSGCRYPHVCRVTIGQLVPQNHPDTGLMTSEHEALCSLPSLQAKLRGGRGEVETINSAGDCVATGSALDWGILGGWIQPEEGCG